MTRTVGGAVLVGLACAAAGGASLTRADEGSPQVAVAAAPGFERGCRALDAELRSIGVRTAVLDGADADDADVERAARATGATAVVRCVGDPPRFVIRILDGSWPTDPAFVITLSDDEVDQAVQSTGEWLRNHLVAGAGAIPASVPGETAPASETPRPPLPPWRRPFLYAGALHDEVVEYDFLKPFLALGGGFFPIDRLHLFVQLSVQPYRVQARTEAVRYRVATDSLQLGVGYLLPLGRGHVGFVAEGRFGTVRANGRGQAILGDESRADVVWNPMLVLGGGLWARARSVVAFRLIGAFRTYVRDTVLMARGERVATIEAHNWVLQWQMEVGL